MTRTRRWWGVMACCGILLVAGCGSSDSGDDDDGSGKSWQCDKSTEISACTCYYDVHVNFANPVSECTPAIGNAAKCCKADAGATTPNCTCSSGYDVGCPAATTEVDKCSGMPAP
jgi:hypothetical protein